MIYKIDRFVFVGGIPLDEQQMKKYRQMTETPVGPLIYVVAEELIPSGKTSKKDKFGTIGVMIGFILMMVLDIALG